MPWKKVSDAPNNIQKLDGVSLSLSQMNTIASMADAIGGDKGWAIAISGFKKSHMIQYGSWVKQAEDTEEKSFAFVEKQDDGRYWITAVSTADLPDREDETFGVEAMDYDIQQAVATKDYPEFRVFHRKVFAIGKVEKMKRAGIFAVDEGSSYDDPFSIEVCEKMLGNNDGKWKVSRGFYPIEVTGKCRVCKEDLVINKEHMTVGFRCPGCDSIHMSYRNGNLSGVRYRKARTYDITVTDIPCVPFTGISANLIKELNSMNKEELTNKLLAAGIRKELIEERLKGISDERLKEYDDIPNAVLLKEFSEKDDNTDDDNDAETFILDPEVLKDFSDIVQKIVAKEVHSAIDGLSIEVEGLDGDVAKESAIAELKAEIIALKGQVALLLGKDEDRLKEMMTNTSRRKLRIIRHKEEPVEDEEDEEDEEEGDEEGMLMMKKKKKSFPSTVFHDSARHKDVNGSDVEIVTADGSYPDMTTMILGGNSKPKTRS